MPARHSHIQSDRFHQRDRVAGLHHTWAQAIVERQGAVAKLVGEMHVGDPRSHAIGDFADAPDRAWWPVRWRPRSPGWRSRLLRRFVDRVSSCRPESRREGTACVLRSTSRGRRSASAAGSQRGTATVRRRANPGSRSPRPRRAVTVETPAARTGDSCLRQHRVDAERPQQGALSSTCSSRSRRAPEARLVPSSTSFVAAPAGSIGCAVARADNRAGPSVTSGKAYSGCSDANVAIDSSASNVPTASSHRTRSGAIRMRQASIANAHCVVHISSAPIGPK